MLLMRESSQLKKPLIWRPSSGEATHSSSRPRIVAEPFELQKKEGPLNWHTWNGSYSTQNSVPLSRRRPSKSSFFEVSSYSLLNSDS